MTDNRINISLLAEHRGVDSNTFTGRPQGEEVRKVLKLDELDFKQSHYNFLIPLNTTSFNASFFLGLFFDSIKNLKGYENFEEKYHLVFTDEDDELIQGLKNDLKECKRQANNEYNQKTGLNI